MKLLDYEHHSEPLLSTGQFMRRLVGHVVVGSGLILVALTAGTCGYRFTEDMSWLDAFYNASMILGGMGPVNELHTTAGKLFASVYAIISGLGIIAIASVLLVPLVHRLLHALHLATPGEEKEQKGD
jgi:hypothetical protein